ncbi:methyltransferase domain-containing protein [Patescibacteria group bacterium]
MDQSTHNTVRREGTKHWWFVGRKQIFAKLLKNYLPKSNLNILDLGCGSGNMYSVLSKYGKLTGVDNSGEVLAYAQKIGYEKIVKANALDLPLNNNEYDLVVAVDLIEHIDDENKFINEIFRVMKPGGYLFITTAAFDSLWSRLDELSHHKRRYTKVSLMKSLSRPGWQLEKIRYYNVFLFWPIVIKRMIDKMLSNKSNDASDLYDLRTPPAIINNLLENILISEKYFIGIPFPAGVSLMAIVKKNG